MGAMRAPRAVLTLLAAVAVAAGCGSAIRPEVLRTWVGRPVAALEKDWGPATREVQDGELRILVYEELEKTTSRNFQDAATARSAGINPNDPYALAAQEAYRSPSVYVRSYLFWVNPEGTIVNAAVRQP